MGSFAKFMEVCETLSKLRIFIYLFPNLWNYVKFGHIFKNYLFLPNLWRFVNFCPKFLNLFIFVKFMELCQVLPKFVSNVKKNKNSKAIIVEFIQ
jgi:hypothetical protein